MVRERDSVGRKHNRKAGLNPAEPIPQAQPPAPQARPMLDAMPDGVIYMIFGALILLLLHYVLAALSGIGENPTVDEVLHLPAGISYWETGSFKLYRHNPPLVKLVAAFTERGRHVTTPIYESQRAWLSEYPSQATFGQYFQLYNAQHYFDVFLLPRLIMPLFSVLGGLVVLRWSHRLHGRRGAMLSLALWCLCPNILAHTRLITSDVGAAVFGCLTVYAFWSYLQNPRWWRVILTGAVLGLAELTKFSALLLYGIIPLLWLVHEFKGWREHGLVVGAVLKRAVQVGAAFALSVLVIDLGYGFEGVGTPLGRFSFASKTLTQPGVDARVQSGDLSGNPLIDESWRHRVNRFRGTWLGAIPSPLPRHYLLGFDEQKIEADGVPLAWLDPKAKNSDEVTGYPVYLDGVLRRTGWRVYYLKTLLYKVPLGTWMIVVLASGVGLASLRRSRDWFNTFTIAMVPAVVMFSMTFLTDINLGLRYILPIFPYVYIGCGCLVPWAERLAAEGRRWAWGVLAVPLLMVVGAVVSIHPHYLAFFNAAAGGPSHGSDHLIDSNLDWGQDLRGLRSWIRAHPESQPIGLAYFGQISPDIFRYFGSSDVQGFDWFMPPALPGRLDRLSNGQPAPVKANPLRPGYYAVSAALVRGLPWRLSDSVPPESGIPWVIPTWNSREQAFAYFRDLTPLPESIGYSILLYKVTEADAARLNARYWPTAGAGQAGQAVSVPTR